MRRSEQQQELIDRQRDAAGHRAARFADLQIDWVDETTGELIGRFGGRYDKKLREYIGDAPTSRVVKMHAGQVEAAREFVRWLGVHLGDPLPPGEKRIFAWLVSGGRRGGKSFFLFQCMCAYAVAVPDAITWAACPSDSFYEEPIDYIESILPSAWYVARGWPWWRYDLPNGSRIVLRSAFKAQKQKKGRCSFVAINEAQQIPESSMTALSGATVDDGGLVMAAANPPDVGDKGEWVAAMAAEARGAGRGEREHERHDFFDPMANPHIDHEALMALAARMSPHEFNVQVRGMFLLPPDAVLHSWDRTANEQLTPDIGECTEEFVRHFEGRGATAIVGIDVQNYPWIAAVVFKAFRNPDAPNDMTRAFLWAVDEVYVDQGDEVDTAADLIDLGLNPDRTIIICDASGDWQQQQRDDGKQRPKYKGKGSHDMFRGEGFRWVVGPDPDMASNPDVAERCRAACARIGNAKGDRFVFADPKCKKTVNGIRLWKHVNGKVSRNSKSAHGGDAFTYVLWRFFPRRAPTGTVDIKTFRRRRSNRGLP